MWSKPVPRRPLIALLLALSALAWLALWGWGQSPYSRFLSHHALKTAVQNPTLAPIFIVGWVVMTVAMMLPTTVPLVALFGTLTRGRRHPAGLVSLLIAGYVGAWTLFGAALYAGDWLLHRAVEASEALADQAWRFSALTVLLAGVYQFTPLKYHCLDKCRSPLGFIATHWHGSSDWREAFVLGVHHGLFCIGCCWSLMLLMFAVGAGSLGWMLVLGAAMAAEKNLPQGRRLSAPLGYVLVMWGVVLLVASPTTHVH